MITTTIDELNILINTPQEGCNLEFKRAENSYATEKAISYCVAIANEGGGKLILGISDKVPRMILGTQAFPNLQDIQSKIFVKVRFRVDVEAMDVEGKRVVIFHIPSRPQGVPYEYDGSYLMRIGDELRPMSQDKLKAIFNEGEPDWFSEIALPDLDSEQIFQILDTDSFYSLFGRPIPERKGIIDRFKYEHLISNIGNRFAITNLGAILFAKNLEYFPELKRKAVRVIVYQGNNKTVSTKKVEQIGQKGYAVGFKGLIDFVGSFLPKNEVIGKALRDTVPMYPDIAIRELIANAIIHQDYTETGTSILVEIYSDRIEISNPGIPPIPPERFIDEFQSRNERLASLMRKLRICEELGSGIDKVIQSIELFQLPAPYFYAGDKRTTITLFAHKFLEDMDSNDKIRACYQHCVLRWLMKDWMTNQSLRERFGLPENKNDVISKIFADTVEAQLIKSANPQSSSRRYTQYLPYWA